jgi:hypothetical protein
VQSEDLNKGTDDLMRHENREASISYIGIQKTFLDACWTLSGRVQGDERASGLETSKEMRPLYPVLRYVVGWTLGVEAPLEAP